MPPAAHGFSLRREPLGVAIRVEEWVDSTSIFSGYGEIRSMYERLESIVLALRRWRALSSNTSLVNKRVTSMMMEGSRPGSLYSLISGRAVLLAASWAAAGFAAPSLAAAASLAGFSGVAGFSGGCSSFGASF